MPPRLKVVTLVDYVVAGGAERAAVDIATRLGPDVQSTLVSSRLQQSAAASPRYRATIAELESAGVRFVGAGRSSTYKPWEWRPVVRLLRHAGADILHTHSWGSNFWGPALARAGGVPVHVAHEQTPFAREGGARHWGRQIVVNRLVTGPFSDAIIVPSHWSKEALVRHEGVGANKIHVVPNGAPPRREVGRSRAAVREELELPNAAPVAIVAAMLRPEKAQDVLIKATALLTEEWPNFHLVIAGGGPTESTAGTRPELEVLSDALGVGARVRFLGHRSDVADLVAASDVAVLSSVHENLPLAMLEYMESGTPIVATAVGGVPELIEDGVQGLLVPSCDPASMARAISAVLHDPLSAERRARAAQARRRAEFDWIPISRRVRELYDELLSQRPGH